MRVVFQVGRNFQHRLGEGVVSYSYDGGFPVSHPPLVGDTVVLTTGTIGKVTHREVNYVTGVMTVFVTTN